MTRTGTGSKTVAIADYPWNLARIARREEIPASRIDASLTDEQLDVLGYV